MNARMSRVLLLLLLALPWPLSAADRLLEERVRDGRVAAAVGFDRGSSAGDPAAQLWAHAEYGFGEHFAAGLGWVYVDGLDPLQAHGLELLLKAYLFAAPLDAFLQASLQPCFAEDGLRLVFTGRLGVEWQTPWKAFWGVEACLAAEPAAVGWLIGSFLGVRF